MALLWALEVMIAALSPADINYNDTLSTPFGLQAFLASSTESGLLPKVAIR